MTDAITGACLCGGCRYRSDAPVMNVRACHCRRRQRATGSGFYPRVMVPLASVTIDGPVTWHDGDTGVRRSFCPTCGSTMFSERAAVVADAGRQPAALWRRATRHLTRCEFGG